jgi:hypothetical protein
MLGLKNLIPCYNFLLKLYFASIVSARSTPFYEKGQGSGSVPLTNWTRIREAQKHADHTDPQDCQEQSSMRSDLTCSLSVALMRMFFSLTFSQIISGQSLVFSTTRRLPVVRITSLPKQWGCGDIVVMFSLLYVVAFNPWKILLINPQMGWGSKSGNSDVWRKSFSCKIVSWVLWAVE